MITNLLLSNSRSSYFSVNISSSRLQVDSKGCLSDAWWKCGVMWWWSSTFSSIHHCGSHSIPSPSTQQYEVIKDNPITSCSRQNNEITRVKAIWAWRRECSHPNVVAMEVRARAEVTLLSSDSLERCCPEESFCFFFICCNNQIKYDLQSVQSRATFRKYHTCCTFPTLRASTPISDWSSLLGVDS